LVELPTNDTWARDLYLPAEWHKQSAIQLTWPHDNTDWDYMLDEIIACYVELSHIILSYQKLLIVCKSADAVRLELKLDKDKSKNLILVELPTNDTWARDHSGISIISNNGEKILLDFTFNGWGMKFPANFDNLINRGLFQKHVFQKDVKYINKKNFVLEGGAIDSDGKGTILTTSECMLSPNRNSFFDQEEIDLFLKKTFGLQQILWLNNGYLSGDDTDSHIDTLARFCNEDTIAYVKCDNVNDEHYNSLLKMEEQLKTFVNLEGRNYNLVPLPMVDPIYDEAKRLPATYANFLILNDVVIMPFYKTEKDEKALNILKKEFKGREVIGINCLPIIKQNGSLHCITMQYPEGFI